jgi:uncharacterized Zn finger protein
VGYYDWKPYVTVAERRRKAAREVQKLKKKGHAVSPVVIEGRTIARTFWGKAWCENLERYSDFANRLDRGRTYVRNGSVIDLQIAPGEVSALVSGSEIYQVAVKVSTLPRARWTSLRTDCAGAIDSLVELLQGRFAKGVMERICEPKTGLFPSPAEIQFSCNCPDWASMCKHVAAVFYGIGARLDEQPELLFTLRQVDEKELIAKAGKGLPLAKKGPAKERVLGGADLSALFGLDLSSGGDAHASEAAGRPATPARARRATKTRAAPATGKAVRAGTPAPRRSSAATRREVPKPGAREKIKAGAKAGPSARNSKRKSSPP